MDLIKGINYIRMRHSSEMKLLYTRKREHTMLLRGAMGMSGLGGSRLLGSPGGSCSRQDGGQLLCPKPYNSQALYP